MIESASAKQAAYLQLCFDLKIDIYLFYTSAYVLCMHTLNLSADRTVLVVVGNPRKLDVYAQASAASTSISIILVCTENTYSKRNAARRHTRTPDTWQI